MTTHTTLAPYTGEWTDVLARHLLRRATYGPVQSEFDESLALGMTASVNRLVSTLAPAPAPPVYFDYDENPHGGIGADWTEMPLYRNPDTGLVNLDNNARRRSLDRWMLGRFVTDKFTACHKMTMFWHNHFGINTPGEVRTRYSMFRTYRDYAFGDFRELIKVMTIHPSMLIFLNGNRNRKEDPDENFAREILELFTIGKGPLVTGGQNADYTHYTESDIDALARVFTGWRTRNLFSTENGTPEPSFFFDRWHDTGTKQLSHRFGNAVIEPAGAEEYASAIDIIFEQDEVARFICRKLYVWFVHYNVSPEIESTVIEPLAAILRDNDYVIAPVLKALFTSAHFYERSVIGGQIKSPIDFTTALYATSGFIEEVPESDAPEWYLRNRFIYGQSRNMGQDLGNPPSVAGWEAYYQAPSFQRLWLNSTTLQARTGVQRQSLRGVYRRNREDPNIRRIDWLGLLGSFRDPYSAEGVIVEYGERMLPLPLAPEQLADLKEILLAGQEDFVWGNEYGDLVANPDDEDLRKTVNRRLTDMLYGMMQLAEYQLQ